MGGLSHILDEPRIPLVPFSIPSLKHALPEERFQVVEHQQTAALL